MQEKKELRIKAKEIRNSLDIETISENIVKNILGLKVYQDAKNVMIFYPLKYEIHLLALLNGNKNFYLPRVNGSELLVCPYKTGDELIISKFNTKEPTSKPVNPNILDIVFVPALMIDENFNRLGYGGGFYDRFLSQNATNATKIVAIPSQLIIENIPSESFDIKMDIIVTETRH